MKLRCPYCQHVFEPQAKPECPNCHKVMFMPHSYQKTESSGADDAQPDAQTQAGRPAHKPRVAAPELPGWVTFFRKPRVIIWIVFILLMMGLIFVRFVARQQAPEAEAYARIAEEERKTPWIWQKLLAFPASVRIQSAESRARESLYNLRLALEIFYRDCGRYPTTSETLHALIRGSRTTRGWDGPYIQALWLDPWKHSYHYALTNGMVNLCSMGPDGMLSTVDDIPAPPPDAEWLKQYYATNPPPRLGR